MLTYVTIDGRVLDLSDLDDEQQEFFDGQRRVAWKAIEATRSADVITRQAFGRRIYNVKNPLLRATDGFVTTEIWVTPLWQALHDLDHRIGAVQGKVRAPEGSFLGDPLEDSLLTVAEAATEKGVTVKAVHKAIERGDVIAEATAGEGSALVVSANSVQRWKVSKVRQAAGKAAGVVQRAKASPTGRTSEKRPGKNVAAAAMRRGTHGTTVRSAAGYTLSQSSHKKRGIESETLKPRATSRHRSTGKKVAEGRGQGQRRERR